MAWLDLKVSATSGVEGNATSGIGSANNNFNSSFAVGSGASAVSSLDKGQDLLKTGLLVAGAVLALAIGARAIRRKKSKP